VTTWRELLQVRLQIARLESELGRAVAALERVVGVQLNAEPPAAAPATTPGGGLPPPPADGGGPFRRERAEEPKPEEPGTTETEMRSPITPSGRNEQSGTGEAP
jgi:hypothetical protein